MSRWLIAFSMAFVVCVGFPADSEAGITIDGNLADWHGLVSGPNGYLAHSDDTSVKYDSSHGLTNTYPPNESNPATQLADFEGRTDSLAYVFEDSPTTEGWVGPNSGGQNYDAEFMGAFVDLVGGQQKLFIAIATGQRSDNGGTLFAPGDIRFAVPDSAAPGGINFFGLEVGADNSEDVGGNKAGKTWTLDGNGYTVPAGTVSHTAQFAGSVWDTIDVGGGSENNGEWIDDPVGTPTETQFDIGSAGSPAGSFVGAADAFVYLAPASSQHAFIELRLDVDTLFGGVLPSSIAWSPSCGNDRLEVKDVPGAPPIPEPASFVVWSLLTLVGCASAWRRRRATRAAF